MVALKYLVIGITEQLEIFINKSFMNGSGNGIKNHFRFEVVENTLHPFQLPWIFRKNEQLEFFGFPAFQVTDQQVKLPVEGRLFPGIMTNGKGRKCFRKGVTMPETHQVPLQDFLFPLRYTDEITHRYLLLFQFIIRIIPVFGFSNRLCPEFFLYPQKRLEVFDTVGNMFTAQGIILDPDHGVLRKKVKQGNPFFIFKLGINIGNDTYLQQFTFTQLGFGIHDPDGVHFIPV